MNSFYTCLQYIKLCLLLDSSYLDYIKTGGFFYSFWVTLMIVLITGTARISLFCMGYILACFIFLWLGEDMILKPVRKLLSMWMGLLIYNYLVIMAKCALQVCVVDEIYIQYRLLFLGVFSFCIVCVLNLFSVLYFPA